MILELTESQINWHWVSHFQRPARSTRYNLIEYIAQAKNATMEAALDNLYGW